MDQRVLTNKPALYALRGVSKECPENTLSAIRAAVCQGYDGVILDVQVTADGIPVLCRKPNVADLCYAQVSCMDVGGAFARRFLGETIPRLSDALDLTTRAGLRVILNMDLVPKDRERDVLLLGMDSVFCFADVQRVVSIAEALPEARVGYCGVISELILQNLSRLGERLSVWTDQPENVPLIQNYTTVNILGVESYTLLEQLSADHPLAAVGSAGVVKPDIRRGFRVDIHMHSEYSQDSTCPVAEIGRAAQEKGFDLVCITDHCDIRPGHDEESLLAFRKQAVAGIRECAASFENVRILAGVELGGGFFEPEIAGRMVAAEDYDVVIGSVHGILFRGQRRSTSGCDFSQMDMEAILEYLDGYLDSVLYVAEQLDVDILAHVTYILRYLNGKYKLNVSWKLQEEKIRKIFAAIIKRGIPLEINTSCRGGVYDEWLPAKEIVDMYLQMGGYLFTFGSDAHVSKRLGSYYEEVTDHLRSRGVRYLIYFQNRIAHQYSI